MVAPVKAWARLENRVDLNERYIQLNFELVEPHTLSFQAGQYVSIQVDEAGHRRSYSISNNPEIDHGFELLIDLVPAGIGTQYLQNLKLGDTIHLVAPLGVFTVARTQIEPELYLIATGSGVTPFRAMLFDLLQTQRDTRQITLFWGMRKVEHLFWVDEFQELAEAFPQFHFHPVISQALKEWELCRGRVTDCLLVHQINYQAGFYICGSTPMITDVTAFLAQKSVPKDRVHFEKFF